MKKQGDSPFEGSSTEAHILHCWWNKGQCAVFEKCKRGVDNSRLSINRHHANWLVYLSNLRGSSIAAKWLLFIRTINKSTLFQPETERMFAIHYERLIFMKPGAQRGLFDCHRTKGWMEESILVNEISNWSMKFLGLTFKGSKFALKINSLRLWLWFSYFLFSNVLEMF